MNYRIIDKETYYRKEVFRHFSEDCRCSTSMTARIDVTDLAAFSKEKGTKFHLNFLYILSKVLNSRDDYKMGYLWQTDELICYDSINPTQYVFHEDNETCTPVYTTYDEDYKVFYENALHDLEEAKKTREYGLDMANHPNWFDASYISWLSYDSLNIELPDGYLFFAPIINWGKYREEGGRLLMPVTAEAGFDRLSTITESGVYKILERSDIKPFRIQYYCERRDADFDNKMHNVLLVYKQLSMQFDEEGNLLPFDTDDEVIHVISYDEKPGLQAIATTSPDLPPSEKNGTIKRDYEYRRLGTVSLLAGIDLQTGEAIPLVRSSHNSDDYISFLRILDEKYPKGDKIRLVLDNLKVHTSEAVKTYLATNRGCFEFVFTPKHAFWLNLVESFFSKMTKQMLKGIRVKTKQEFVDRIYKYFDGINAEPVVFHWFWNLEDIDPSEHVKVETLLKKSS